MDNLLMRSRLGAALALSATIVAFVLAIWWVGEAGTGELCRPRRFASRFEFGGELRERLHWRARGAQERCDAREFRASSLPHSHGTRRCSQTPSAGGPLRAGGDSCQGTSRSARQVSDSAI